MKNQLPFTICKIALLSLLMLFSLKWVGLLYALLAVAVLIVATEKDFNGIYYCFLLVNFRFIFRHNLTGSIPYVGIVFCVFAISAVIKYWIIRKEKPKFNWWIIGLSGAYLLYLLLPIYKFIFAEYLKFVLMIFVLNFVFLFKDKIELKKLIIFFVTGCLIASFIFAISQVWFKTFFIPLWESSVTSYGAMRYRGLAGDPNYYSLDLIISMAGLYYLYFKKQLKIYWVCPLLALLSVFCWLTYSKSMLVGLVVLMALVVIFSCVKNIKSNWYKPLIFIGLALFGVILTQYIMGLGTLGVIGRFQDKATVAPPNQGGIPAVDTPSNSPATGDTQQPAVGQVMDSVLTGRWTLWKNHLAYVFSSFKNFMFGGGIGTFVEPMECHNTAIQILYETGFVGAILLIAIFILIFKEFGFNKKLFRLENWMNWLVILVGVVMFCNVNYLASTSFIYHITIFMFVLFNQQEMLQEARNDNNIHTNVQQGTHSNNVVPESNTSN